MSQKKLMGKMFFLDWSKIAKNLVTSLFDTMTMTHLPPPPEVVGGVEKLCDKENSFTNGQKLGRIIFCHHNTSINNMAFVLFCHQHNLQKKTVRPKMKFALLLMFSY